MLKQLLGTVGLPMKVGLHSDSSAATAFSQRQGIAKLQFLEVKR